MMSNHPDHILCSLIDFFRYYSRDFSYNTGVASIRAGLLKKESKGWQNDVRWRICTSSPSAYWTSSALELEV